MATVVPAPASTSSVLPMLLSNLLGGAVVAIAFIAYDHFYRQPAAPPPPALAVIAKAYRDGQGNAVHAVAAALRNGTLKDGTSIANALAAHSKPIASALTAAVKAGLDASNNVDPGKAALVANDLDTVATALGGKW